VAALEAAFAVVVGVVVSLVLGWLILSGLLGATFKQARTMLRRAIQRRQAARPGAVDRRNTERRQS
jgi:hypothetical protein